MKMNKYAEQRLNRTKLPLDLKEALSRKRVADWYEYHKGKVYIAFSGGKDSTVLLHLIRNMYSCVPAVFVNTGLEYPEIIKFVKTTSNVTWLKPKYSFKKVLKKYGFPVVSKENAQKIYEIRNTNSDKLKNKRLYGDSNGHGKLPEKWKYLIDTDFKISHKCCDIMKKNPTKKYEKQTNRKPYIGIMASDSALRSFSYKQHGCNNYESNRPVSNPLSFWTQKDIWTYIKKYDIADIYNTEDNTGCMFCMFGIHLEKEPNKFQRMKITHPKHYKFCIETLNLKQPLDYLNINYTEDFNINEYMDLIKDFRA